MPSLIVLSLWLAVIGGLSYHRVNLKYSSFAILILLIFSTIFHLMSAMALVLLWLIIVPTLVIFNLESLRIRLISTPVYKTFKSLLPTISATEKAAIDAGNVWWEGEIFAGKPNWEKLFAIKAPTLSPEEQEFCDGPLQQLLGMTDDWEITHELKDLPEQTWQFLKDNGFFGLMIAKEYGGKQFSDYAHSQILTCIASKSITLASIVAVPNSLGPAELISIYGTPEQKDYYLPRLASGEEIPCFGLTGPKAGSDATSMPDTGVICYGEYDGEEVVGIKLNFSKRYITLAPIATVVAIAFKLYDPENLLEGKKDLGITCALIPATTKGLEIGRRHLPLNTPFQNGPIIGKDVFVPLDFIIGGKKMVGCGWRMLVECLSTGRAISLPSIAAGSAKITAFNTTAYSEIRSQFKTEISKFEAVAEKITEITGLSYIIDAARIVTVQAIDAGAKPSVAGAIVKAHATDLSRKICCNAMDIHGGKAIMEGPKNPIAPGYFSNPIGITVEGANILTKALIIFGQGAIRCHPYILAEINAAANSNFEKGAADFDNAFSKHIGYTTSNVFRSLFLNITAAKFVKSPVVSRAANEYKNLTRLSSTFALAADIVMISLGGKLKFKELISQRLGEMLSAIYLISTTLKFYHSQNEPEEDYPVVKWCCQYLTSVFWLNLQQLIANLPTPAAWGLRLLTFATFKAAPHPSDKLSSKVAKLSVMPEGIRQRLAQGTYIGTGLQDYPFLVNAALCAKITAAPILKSLKAWHKEGKVKSSELLQQVEEAMSQGLLSAADKQKIIASESLCDKVIAVDDFAATEIAETSLNLDDSKIMRA